MTDQPIFRIEVARIFAVSRLYRLREGVLPFRHRNNVNMVIHQRVGPNEDPMQITGVSRQAEIYKPIRVIIKNIFFAVTSLQDVMRTTRHNDASESHSRTLSMRKGRRQITAATRVTKVKIRSQFG
jgi:hypothetical protein